MQVQVVLHVPALSRICLRAHKQPVASPAHKLVPVIHTRRRPFGRARHLAKAVGPCSEASKLRHVLFRELPAPERLEIRREAVWVDALGNDRVAKLDVIPEENLSHSKNPQNQIRNCKSGSIYFCLGIPFTIAHYQEFNFSPPSPPVQQSSQHWKRCRRRQDRTEGAGPQAGARESRQSQGH